MSDHPDLCVRLIDGDGRDYYARLHVEHVGKGYVRFVFVGAAGCAEGKTLCRADLDPESVADLRAALPTPPTEAPDLDAIERRDAEWQERLAPLHEGHTGDGCDSGDPIDWSVAALSMARDAMQDRIDALEDERAAARLDALNARAVAAEAIGCYETLAVLHGDDPSRTAADRFAAAASFRARLASPDAAAAGEAVDRLVAAERTHTEWSGSDDEATVAELRKVADAALAVVLGMLGAVEP